MILNIGTSYHPTTYKQPYSPLIDRLGDALHPARMPSPGSLLVHSPASGKQIPDKKSYPRNKSPVFADYEDETG